MVFREGSGKVKEKETKLTDETVEAKGRRKKSLPKKVKSEKSEEKVDVAEVGRRTQVDREIVLLHSSPPSPPLPLEEVQMEEVQVEKEEGQVVGEEEVASCEPAARRGRRGGRESRMRRMLAHQLLLTEKRGYPLSRLLTTMMRANTRTHRQESRRLQEESAYPVLRRREVRGEEVEGEVRRNNHIKKPCS